MRRGRVRPDRAARRQNVGGGNKNDAKEKPEPPGPIQQNTGVFTEDWMNVCYKEVIYPDPSCTKVLEKVNAALANRVLRPQDSEQKQQALFYLLGPEFTEQNFPRSTFNPMLLEPPKMQPQQKENYLSDMRHFLKKALKKSIKDCHYPDDMIGYRKENELGQYLQEVREVFSEGLRKQAAVFLFEMESKKMKSNSDDGGPKPVCGMREVDVAGLALIALVKYDPSKREVYKQKLSKKAIALPLVLRQFFWWSHISLREKESLRLTPSVNPLEAIVKKFNDNLKKQMKASKLTGSSQHKNKHLIDQTVIDLYDDTPAMKILDTNDNMITTARILNLLDIHSSNFSPTLIYLLAPLQCIFHKPQDEAQHDKYHIEMAARLEVLLRQSQVSTEDIWSIADRVLEHFQYEDMDYMDHLKEALYGQALDIRPRNFPPESIAKENSAKLYEEIMSKGINRQQEEIFSTPHIFIRKWIIQAFVGVLNIPATLWCWDQLCLNGWSCDTMEHLVKAVFCLLRPWVMKTTEYTGVSKVLLNEPREIYLYDLQQAYIYYRDDGKGKPPRNCNFLGKKKKKEEKQEKKEKKTRNLLSILPAEATSTFNLDIQLSSDEDEEEEAPKTPTPPPSPKEEKEERPKSPVKPPSPQVVPSAPNLDEIWVPQNTDDDEEELPDPSGISEPFELYIDSLRCVPDDITVCKMVGKVIRYSSNAKDKSSPEVIGFPVHSSPQICPSYRCRLVLNKERQLLNPTMIILLRVYGVQKHDGNLAVLGSCVIEPFTLNNGPPELRVGGYQLRLRHGLPSGNIDKLNQEQMKECPQIPGATICVRLLPHKKKPVSPPLYEDGFYDTSECKPTEKEMILYQHYTDSVDYDTETVGDSTRALQRKAGIAQTRDGPGLQKYLEHRLNHKAIAKKNKKPIPDLDYSRFLTYDITCGVNIDVQAAFGLPREADNLYTMAYGEILPGKETLEDEERDGDTPIREHMCTIHLDFMSATRSPQWLDEYTNMRPMLDENSMLLIKVFGISPSYTAIDGFTPGEVTNSEGGNFKIDLNNPVAWTIAPIFNSDSVIAGLHWFPLFEGSPPDGLLSKLHSSKPFKKILLDAALSQEITVAEGASIEVKIWDDQLAYEDLPETRHDNIIQAFPPVKKFTDVRNKKFNKTFDNFVVDSLDEERAMNPEEIAKERDLFKDVANMTFFQTLNESLREAGKEVFPKEFYMIETPPPSPTHR